MSNGSKTCPVIDLGFGLFPASPLLDQLDDSSSPPADPPPALEQFVLDNAPDAATPADGFDSVFDDTVAIIDALDTALGSIAFDLLAAFTEADTIDAAPVGDTITGFAGSLAASSSAVDDLGTLLSSVAAPGGGGGGAPTATDNLKVVITFTGPAGSPQTLCVGVNVT